MIGSWSSLQRGAIILLLAACVGLAAIIYAEVSASPFAPADAALSSSSAQRAKSPSDDGSARFSLRPLQSFSVVTERPLFAQTRRPSARGSDDTLGPWSSFTLAGIIISPTAREALILHGQPPTVVHLQEGQDVEGWTVTSILPDRIVLRGGDAEHELKLLDKQGPSASPVTAPRRNFNR